MVTDLLGALLQELAKALKIAALSPDSNNSCLVKLASGLQIQIELDRTGEFLILGSDLGEVPPGKYRENLFKEALKANDADHPIHGILAFSKKTEHLVLFEKISIKDLNGAAIAEEIAPFAEKGLMWENAIKRGEIPVITGIRTSDKASGMFGLRP